MIRHSKLQVYPRSYLLTSKLKKKKSHFNKAGQIRFVKGAKTVEVLLFDSLTCFLHFSVGKDAFLLLLF